MSAKFWERMRALLTTLGSVRKKRRSPAFEAYRFSFFEDPGSARDGLDIGSLQQLKAHERDLAERQLIDALPDTRAIVGLGELGARRAERRLVAIFERECATAQAARIADDPDWRAHRLIAAAKALWRIAPRQRYARAIVGTLECGRSRSERMDAAAALQDMPSPETEQALTEALDDVDCLVRHLAARSLLALHGVETDAHAMNNMMYRVMAQDPERRENGRRDIVAAVERSLTRGGVAALLRYERGG